MSRWSILSVVLPQFWRYTTSDNNAASLRVQQQPGQSIWPDEVAELFAAQQQVLSRLQASRNVVAIPIVLDKAISEQNPLEQWEVTMARIHRISGSNRSEEFIATAVKLTKRSDERFQVIDKYDDGVRKAKNSIN